MIYVVCIMVYCQTMLHAYYSMLSLSIVVVGWEERERERGSVRDTEKSKLVVVWFEGVYIVYNKVQTFVLLWALPVCGYCGP